MDYQKLRILYREFSKKLEEQHTFYLDSIVGFSILEKRVLKEQARVKEILGKHEFAKDDFLDKCGMLYRDFSDKDVSPLSSTLFMKQGEIKARTKENGINYFILGANCLVALYSYWEEYLRIEIGKAIGVLLESAENCEKTRKILNKHVISDIWGDIRHLRNSIVHKNCIASSRITECKVIKCFSPGKKIELDFNKMQAIFILLARYRNELHRMSFSPHYIKVTKFRREG